MLHILPKTQTVLDSMGKYKLWTTFPVLILISENYFNWLVSSLTHDGMFVSTYSAECNRSWKREMAIFVRCWQSVRRSLIWFSDELGLFSTICLCWCYCHLVAVKMSATTMSCFLIISCSSIWRRILKSLKGNTRSSYSVSSSFWIWEERNGQERRR